MDWIKINDRLPDIGERHCKSKDKNIIEAKKKVEKIVFAHKEVLQMHGFHLDAKDKTLSFDIIIDFKAENCEKIYQDIYDAIQKEFKNSNMLNYQQHDLNKILENAKKSSVKEKAFLFCIIFHQSNGVAVMMKMMKQNHK